MAREYELVNEERTFLEVLKSYGDDTWWKLMHCDDEETWIRRAIRIGTLMISHDRSYMPGKPQTVSGAGVLAFCNATRKSLKLD